MACAALSISLSNQKRDLHLLFVMHMDDPDLTYNEAVSSIITPTEAVTGLE